MSTVNIPTSTSVSESAVIAAPLAKVWHLIKLADFSEWWSALESSSVQTSDGTNPEVDVFNWKFKDGTEFTVKQEEHSSIKHSITYSVIDTNKPIQYTSVLSSITCHEITTGDCAGQTFVVWKAEFSSDADVTVIEDAKFKRQEGLADLSKAVARK